MPAVDATNILLVDDQPARLLVYQSILGTLGQNLVCARSGVEALEQLMRQEFAVVLLDVSMPGMDGFETAAMIHGHPRYERTPIIFVTGVHDTEFDRLKGYQLGAVDYVSIPVVPEILRGKVKRAILIDQILRTEVVGKASMTDAQLREFYAKNPERFKKPESVQMQTISVVIPDNATAQQKAQARQRAEGLLKQAKAAKDYEAFGILAEKNSDDDWRVMMGDHKSVHRGRLCFIRAAAQPCAALQ